MNGVLRHFQQYFSHITVTAHFIHVYPGFHQYKAGALKCLAQRHSNKKKKKCRGSRAAQTLNPLITSQTLHHTAMQDPSFGKQLIML